MFAEAIQEGPAAARPGRDLHDALPARDLLRSALGAVLFGSLAIAAPLGVRWAFGTVPLAFALSSMATLSLTLALGVAPTVWVTRLALARGASLGLATLAGVLTAIPVMVISYLCCLAVQRSFPAFAFLDPNEPQTIRYSVLTAMADALPWLGAWAGLVFTPTLLRAHELRSKRLEALQRDSELLRLRSHLEPHFVLNTMNAIAGLVTEDPAAARELLGMLGSVFRDATDSAECHTVETELAWLERFVKIHEMRFPEQLEVRWEVRDDARSCLVPNLILQPLVENALLHGALRVKAGRLTVRAFREMETLVLEVRDNGPGLGPRRPGGKGVALVERRLAIEPFPSQLELRRDGDETVARILMKLPADATQPAKALHA